MGVTSCSLKLTGTYWYLLVLTIYTTLFYIKSHATFYIVLLFVQCNYFPITINKLILIMEMICVICEDETTFNVQFEWPSVLKALIFRIYSV
jgi:hypothetical protein